MTVHDFPTGSYEQQNKFIRELIGNNCCTYEHVLPIRLYTVLHMKIPPAILPGKCVSMLIDEDGRLKENVPNQIGSYLYETDRHGCPIMGNVLFVSEKWCNDGIEFCGIEDSVFKMLETQLKRLILKFKKIKEELGL